MLSLTTAHSFELGEVARYLHSATVRRRADPGPARRADVHHALALGRRRVAGAAALPRRPESAAAARAHGRRGPDRQRCFPTRSPAPRTSSGEREVPDHPLVNQTISDCLTEAMDIEGLERLLAGIESGAIRVVARDLTEPSPLALEVLSARPYAFLDDAPLEERRTQAVMAPALARPGDRRRPRPARSRGDRARARRSWPDADNARRAARCAGLARLPDRGGGAGRRRLERLACGAGAARSGSARLHLPTATLWIAAERLPQFRALWPERELDPPIAAPAAHDGARLERRRRR